MGRARSHHPREKMQQRQRREASATKHHQMWLKKYKAAKARRPRLVWSWKITGRDKVTWGNLPGDSVTWGYYPEPPSAHTKRNMGKIGELVPTPEEVQAEKQRRRRVVLRILAQVLLVAIAAGYLLWMLYH